MAGDSLPTTSAAPVEQNLLFTPPVALADRAPDVGSLKGQLLAKRGLDISIALLVLVSLAPLLLLLCLVVRLSDGGPALFRQTRVGKGGRLFACYKFRSMVLDADGALERHLRANPDAAREWAATQKLADDPRVTPLGRFLRKSSLDELPQVLNVLAGDMSLIGPRPIVPAECARYEDALAYYVSVKPGITGLWQISGRSNCSYAERIALDVRYAANWSLRDDLMILALTVPAVLLQRGSC